jgi:hypothetical protein
MIGGGDHAIYAEQQSMCQLILPDAAACRFVDFFGLRGAIAAGIDAVFR